MKEWITMNTKNGWIPVTDMLPGTATNKVIVSTKDRYVAAVTYYKGHFNASSDSYDSEWDDVVAWMPMPKPYEVEGDE